MTTNHEFDRQLADWLHETSAQRVPDHVLDVLLVTRATRQRPWWSSLERWLPMQATARFAPAVPRLGLIVVAIAVALALAAAVLLAGGAQTRLPAPFGLARNGDFAFGANGDIYRFDPGTGRQTPLITGDTWDFGAGFSRDGTRFTFGRVPGDPATAPANADLGMIVALANADGSDVHELTPALPGNCWSDWSPDGHHLVFRTERPDHHGLLNVLDVDARTFRTIDPGMSVRCSALGYRAPDGAEIVFRGDSDIDHGVFAIHPDGSGLRRVNTERPVCDCDTGVLSPDGRFMAVDRWGGDGLVRLSLLDLESGTERQVTVPASHFSRGGTFSPDGSQVAFPMLHEIGPNQNAYQVAVAPVDGSAEAHGLGPEVQLPATGTDEAFVSIAYSPDGKTLIVAYPDSPTSTTNTIWLLPVDGSAGRVIGSGTFASLDIQRLAP